MIEITKKYDLKWQIDYAPNYQFSKCGKCFNVLRNKEIKETLIGYTVGFCINGKFKSKKAIRTHLVKVDKSECPF